MKKVCRCKVKDLAVTKGEWNYKDSTDRGW